MSSTVFEAAATESANAEISASGAPSRALPHPNVVTVIEPPSGWQLINVAELWKFRELLGFLVWRDVKVRYKQTLLGAAWAVLQPLMMMIVFTIFFGRMAGVNSGGVPYPLFAFAGLLPWTFFSTAISQAGNSVVGSERLITKIYFPRLSIPFASVGAALVDFVIAFGMLLVLMAWYRTPPTVGVLWIPGIVLVITLAALGTGTLLASLNVAYRDFRYVIPFLVQLWMFATPTVYMQPENFAEPISPSAQVTATRAVAIEGGPARRALAPPAASEKSSRYSDNHEGAVPNYIQTLMNLNPMVGLIAGFRAAMLGGPMPWHSLAWSGAGATVMFIIGCLYFRHVEDSFADVI